MGFSTYCSSVSGGEDGTEVLWTDFLKGDQLEEFQNYVPNITAAIINNYHCYLSPTTDGGPVWPKSPFDPSAPLVYPDCFFNLPAYSISQDV
jgi:hypothetical protein